MKELLFLFVLFVSNVIQAITGFAGTVLAMPPSVYLLGLDHAKVVLNVMAWLSGLMIAVTGFINLPDPGNLLTYTYKNLFLLTYHPA